MTNNDADLLYDRATVIQLIQTDRCSLQMSSGLQGTYIHRGVQMYGVVYKCTGVVWMYGGIQTGGCMDIWGAYGYMGIQTWGAHRCIGSYRLRGFMDIGVYRCMGHI